MDELVVQPETTVLTVEQSAFDYNLLLEQQSYTNLALGIIIGLLIVYIFLNTFLRGR